VVGERWKRRVGVEVVVVEVAVEGAVEVLFILLPLLPLLSHYRHLVGVMGKMVLSGWQMVQLILHL
jgi:hypothetical protein